MTEPTPAGWYPDPGNSGQQRYWDGNAWTDDFAPGTAVAAPKSGVVKRPQYKRTWFIVVAVLIGIGVLGNMIGGSPSAAPESTPSATESAPPPVEVEAAPAVVEPEPEPEVEPAAEAAPEMTMGQQQAVQSAEGYLSMGGFSRKSLIEQLVFGDFSKADAEFAVDYLDPDWNAQAEQSAQGYVDMGGFSRKSLIEQLVFGGFTEAQAEYGAKAVGY